LTGACAEVRWEIIAKAKIIPQNVECIRIDSAGLFGNGSQEVSGAHIDTIGLHLEGDLENTMEKGEYEIDGGCT